MPRRAGMLAVALGLSLLGAPAGISNAEPSGDDGSPASVKADADHRGATRATASPQPKHVSVQRHSSKAPAHRGDRSAAPRTPAAKSVSANPLASLFFNRTPTLNPTLEAPGPDGVVKGALNADDPDGDALSYRVLRNPEHGEVTIAADGGFTYIPATPPESGQMLATDNFAVEASDADNGFHLHGLMGVLNLLSFGLIGSAGHTTTRTVSIGVAPGLDPAAYLLPIAPGVSIKPLLTVGDSPSEGNYPMVGSPDGLGVYDNNDGTFTLLMNHELGSGAGAVRAHGATGAFISRYVIDKASLQVIAGSDLIQRVFAWNTGSQRSEQTASAVSFNRFCSGDLAPVSAYSHNSLGTTARIFLTGEEGGAGRAVATIATGADAGNSYVLGTFSPGTNGSGLVGTPSWENLLASPYAQDKTVVIGNNDGGSGVMAGALAVYVGTKQSTGTEADRAGLTNGTLKFVTVAGNPAEIADPGTRATNIASGTAFTLSDSQSTSFSRPEDGAWNPLRPNEYYFVTTDRLDQVSDGAGGQVGQSRLWRLTFADIANPDLGGTIDLLIDGDTVDGHKVNMLDNLAVDAAGRILIQEDTGGAQHNAKIWRYDTGSDSLVLLAGHDPDRFGDIGLPATAPFTIDEESSGIVDAAAVLGSGWYLLTVMAHYPLGGELVEGGQLLALYAP